MLSLSAALLLSPLLPKDVKSNSSILLESMLKSVGASPGPAEAGPPNRESRSFVLLKVPVSGGISSLVCWSPSVVFSLGLGLVSICSVDSEGFSLIVSSGYKA